MIFRNKKKLLTGFLFLLLLFSNSCGLFGELKTISSSPQKISGKINIANEWTEIIPPEPLTASVKINKISVRTDAVSAFDDNDKTSRTLKFKNAESGKVEAVLYDNSGGKHILNLVGIGGKDGGFYLGKINENRNLKEPDFPNDKTYTKLQIRSDVGFQADKIEWINEIQK